MNFRKPFLLSTLILATLSSCKEKEIVAPVVIQTEVLDSLFSQKYHGLLPCGDCPGIETTIGLNADSTLTKTVFYRSKGDDLEQYVGTWKLKDSVFEAKFDGNKEFYKIKSGSTLARVGADQTEVKGKLADDYLLQLKEPLILETLLGTYIQGDTLKEHYKTLNIKEIKKNDYQLIYAAISPTDTCSFKVRGVLDAKNAELNFPLKTAKKDIKGDLIVMFSDELIHLKSKDLENEDDVLQLCDSIPVQLHGMYKKR